MTPEEILTGLLFFSFFGLGFVIGLTIRGC